MFQNGVLHKSFLQNYEGIVELIQHLTERPVRTDRYMESANSGKVKFHVSEEPSTTQSLNAIGKHASRAGKGRATERSEPSAPLCKLRCRGTNNQSLNQHHNKRGVALYY